MRLYFFLFFFIISCKEVSKPIQVPDSIEIKTPPLDAAQLARDKAFEDSLEMERGFERIPEILSDKFNINSYRGTADHLNAEYDEIAQTWIYIRRYSEKPGHQARKAKMIRWQTSEFPSMRQAYGDIFAESLWEENIYVTVSGKKKDIISFTAAAYVNNKNKKDTYDLMIKSLNKFRFKKLIFKWYKGQEDYTYYTLSSAIDTDEVYVSN